MFKVLNSLSPLVLSEPHMELYGVLFSEYDLIHLKWKKGHLIYLKRQQQNNKNGMSYNTGTVWTLAISYISLEIIYHWRFGGTMCSFFLIDISKLHIFAQV